MAFTKQEVYEYLVGYPQDTIPDVLRQLGYGEEVNEYPDDVVEKAENIYKAMGVAATMQKRLSESTQQEDQSSEIVTAQVSAIAFQLLESQDISIPADVVMALAHATVVQSTKLADRLSLLQEQAFATRLGQNQQQFAQKLLSLSSGGNDTIDEILGDDSQVEFIQAIAPAPALPSVKDTVRAFLGKVDADQKATRQISGTREQQRAALPSKKVDINTVRAFLAARK